MKRLICIALASCAITLSCHSAIIISQYYEGASFNKWIELFNTGSAAVDLEAGSYRLGLWANAIRTGWKGTSAPSVSMALTGTLNPGQCYVIQHTGAVLPSYASGTGNSSVINFNGDDSVVLYVHTGAPYNSALVVDAIGATMTGTLGSPLAEASYSRKTTISTGVNTDFDTNDWEQFTLAYVNDPASSTEIAYIGFHIIPEPAALLLLPAALLFFRRK